jgi:hypothetical protein
MVAVAAAGLAMPAAGAPVAGRESAELAREVRLDVRTAPESLAVGDRWTVELRVEVPGRAQVTFPPALPRGIDADLIEYMPGAEDESAPGRPATRTWVARYTLALFAVGPIALPPLSVEVVADSLRATVSTDSLRTFVTTVLTDSLAAAGLRDLKGQAEVRMPLWPWWVAAGVLAVAIAAFLWWRRRRRGAAPVVPLVPQRPAHEVALEALRRLETRRLPLDGKFQEHWVALSEIVRRYLEDGFGVAALEETTEEILFDLERHGFDRTHVLQFRALSDAGDLIKFAKREPTIEECVQALERTREFVQSTAPRVRAFPVPGGDAA